MESEDNGESESESEPALVVSAATAEYECLGGEGGRWGIDLQNTKACALSRSRDWARNGAFVSAEETAQLKRTEERNSDVSRDT